MRYEPAKMWHWFWTRLLIYLAGALVAVLIFLAWALAYSWWSET